MKIFWFLAESSNHLLVYGFIIQKFGLSSAEQFFWWPFLDSLTSHQPLTTSHLCMSIGWCCQLRWQLVTFSNSLAWAYSYSCCSRTPRSSKGEQTSVSKEFSILYWYHIWYASIGMPFIFPSAKASYSGRPSNSAQTIYTKMDPGRCEQTESFHCQNLWQPIS